MNSLTVLYDDRCPMCGWASRWLYEQPQLVKLFMVPAASDQARQMFPNLDHQATLENITVISDEGDVYQNDKAWLMCLWALKRYRHMAHRLASPTMAPQVRRFVAMVSKYRPIHDEGRPGCSDGYCN